MITMPVFESALTLEATLGTALPALWSTPPSEEGPQDDALLPLGAALDSGLASDFTDSAFPSTDMTSLSALDSLL